MNPMDRDSAAKEPSDAAKTPTRNRRRPTNTLEIRTDRDGHNSGRAYHIRTESGAGCRRIAGDLSRLSRVARRRFRLRTAWERCQDRLKSAYDSAWVQALVGALILSVTARPSRQSAAGGLPRLGFARQAAAGTVRRAGGVREGGRGDVTKQDTQIHRQGTHPHPHPPTHSHKYPPPRTNTPTHTRAPARTHELEGGEKRNPCEMWQHKGG